MQETNLNRSRVVARGVAHTRAQTPYGNLTSAELLTACNKMHARYRVDLASTRYRVSLSKANQARDAGLGGIKKARPKSRDELQHLGQAVIALRDCASRTNALSQGDDIRQAGDGTLKSRRRTVQHVEDQCKHQLKLAQGRLDALKKLQYVEAARPATAANGNGKRGKRGRAAQKKVARRGRRRR